METTIMRTSAGGRVLIVKRHLEGSEGAFSCTEVYEQRIPPTIAYISSERRSWSLWRPAAVGARTLDGAAIGAASLVNWRTGLLVAIAVVAHDTSDGLNTILLVTHGERARRGDLVFLVIDALAPVFGGLLALAILPPAGALAIFLGFASGFFLYTATSDLLPEAHRRSPSIAVSLATMAGIVFTGGR